MIEYKTLENTDYDIIFKCWIEAFSDYQVKIDMPFWKFESMNIRRGINLNLSIGAFSENKLVGFILNGKRLWKKKITVYDLGTAVIPDFRKQGITTAMFSRLKIIQKEKKIGKYLLEVLKPNEPAVKLYKKEGFEICRSFLCFKASISDLHLKETDLQTEVLEISKELLDKFSVFHDFSPSWQNSNDSIIADSKNMKLLGFRKKDQIVGYGIIKIKTGDIPQLAVKKEFRRNGIGSIILKELIKHCESSKIAFINIEDGFNETKCFIEKSGIKYVIDQYEMMLSL